MNDAKKLLADMKALGIKEGETILVHTSMKALGTKETPETVLDTLQAALGRRSADGCCSSARCLTAARLCTAWRSGSARTTS